MKSRAFLNFAAVLFPHLLGCTPSGEPALPSGPPQPQQAQVQPVLTLPDLMVPGGDCAGAAYRDGSLCEAKSQVDHIVVLRVEAVEPVIYPAWLALCQREPWIFVDEPECGARVMAGLRLIGAVEHVLHGGFTVGDKITVSIGAAKFAHWDPAPWAESATEYAWVGSEDAPPQVSGLFPGMLVGIPLIEVIEGEETLLNPVSVWFTLDSDNRVVPQVPLETLKESCVRSRFARHAAGLSLEEIAAVEACPLERPLDKAPASPFPSGRWSAECMNGSVYLATHGLPASCQEEVADDHHEEP